MRQQPTTDGSQQCRDQENADFVAEGVDAHRFSHLRRTLERPDGAPRARIQQIQECRCAGQQDRPGQDEKQASLPDIQAADRQALQALQAVVFSQWRQVAHQIVKRQSPGNGGQGQVVPGHAQGDGPHDQRAGGSDGQTDKQGQPRGHAGIQCQPCRRVRANPHKGRLAEGGQSCDAGEQYQTQAHQRIQADVVELHDPEVGQGQQGQDRDGDGQQDQGEILDLHVSGPRRSDRRAASARGEREG